MKYKKPSSLLISFYHYQKERFPIVFLALATLPVILSSAVVVAQNKLNFLHIFLILVASLSYLFHIRVVDDYRDFKHDNLYHEDRPVQKGVISLTNLKKIDIIAAIILLAVAISSNIYGLAIAVFMLIYTYIAEREFFVTKKIRKHFFIYNAVNLFQMTLLQIFVYNFFFRSFYLNPIIITHFLLITTGTSMFDFLRKLKTPHAESTGKDTYTWYFGFRNSLIIYLFFVSLLALLFFVLANEMILSLGIWLVIILIFIAISFLNAYFHWIKKSEMTDKLLQANSLFFYGFLNLLIYFLR
ncbi:MAG: UbiA family prenyltransferase [Candidatus Pacebacteria bacterium]|nr:UbiA family prenyltransferase [Candidatus Paceibacterota bacterium]